MHDLYNKTETFKYGWAAGFYDAVSDDGFRYCDDILRYGLVSDVERADFLAGYRAGQHARVGGGAHHSGPLAPSLPAAA